MSCEQLDTLDEFFDFAQLERDHGHHEGFQQMQISPQPLPVQDVHSPMDWEPTAVSGVGAFAALPSRLDFDESLQTSSDLGSLCPTTFLQPQYCPEDAFEETPASAFSWPSNETGFHFSRAATPTPATTVPPHLAGGTPISPSHRAAPQTQPQRSSSITHKPASAKRKGPSTRIPVEARQMLEEEFAANPYPCSWEIDIIAHQANLDVKRVRNWFNNTRARRKCSGSFLSRRSPHQLMCPRYARVGDPGGEC